MFIPSMWWHHMEALEPFNVLVNYWWRQTPAWMDTPMNALMLAHHDRARPAAASSARPGRTCSAITCSTPTTPTAAHIPEAARRVLAPLDETRARDLRARLLQRLNR